MEGATAWEGMLRVIRGVSSVEDVEQFGPTVLDHVDALIPSDTSSYNEVDPIHERALVVARPDPITSDQLEIWQRWSHQNPSLMHVLRTGDGSAHRISDFISQDELHGLELYEYGYKSIGLEYQLSIGLPAPRPLVLGVALNRGDRDFSDDELRLLDTLRPHLVQAYRHAQLLTDYRHAMRRVSGLLEEEGKAFQVVGEPLGDPARLLLGRHFPSVDGTLPEPVRAWLEAETDQPDRLRRPLVSTTDGRRLTLRYVPGGAGPDLLWMVERPVEVDSEPLERLGLTRREAEALWLLTQGRSTAQIALGLGISTGTTKKHLEHVYRKLGVSSATAAVAAAFEALSF